MNPNSLVAQIYRARYYPHEDVLRAKLDSNPSYAWRRIMTGLEVIRRGTRWRVENGDLIHIWEDKWLPTPMIYKVISPPKLFDNFPMVSALIDKESKRWNADIVLFLPFEENIILNIPLSYNLPDDKIIWAGNNRGVFTMKSAYYIATKLIEKEEQGECFIGDYRTPLWKRMWHLNILTKTKIFT